VEFGLSRNWPNPFNPVTNFEIRIADFGLVTFKVYNVLGQEVAGLVKGMKQPGVYTIHWDASALPGGVYFYRLQSGTAVAAGRALLIK
jgi:hypothetical protein